MKNKNLVALALLGMTTGLGVNAQADENCSSCKNDVELTGQKCKTAANCNGMNGNGKADCSNLTQDESDYARKLNDKNRQAFCGRFSASQRKQAMQMSCNGMMNCGSNRNAGKNVMKPDDAVAKMMRDNNMSMEEKREELTEVK